MDSLSLDTSLIGNGVVADRTGSSDTRGEISKSVQPVFAGWGACKSCGCTGYLSKGDGHTCKSCGHHFTQHK